MTAGDNWLPGCPNGPLCPENDGDDYDLAGSPALDHRRRDDLIVVGQKSGVLWALDPDKDGNVVWQQKVGAGGGLMGGIMWGPAMDNTTAYAGVADGARADGTPASTQINSADGRANGKPPRLRPQQHDIAAHRPVADARHRLLRNLRRTSARTRASTGEVVWEFDTARTFETVNGVTAKGGAMDGAGPAIANGMVVMTSGMGFAGGAAGNVSLRFRSTEKRTPTQQCRDSSRRLAQGDPTLSRLNLCTRRGHERAAAIRASPLRPPPPPPLPRTLRHKIIALARPANSLPPTPCADSSLPYSWPLLSLRHGPPTW